MFVDRVLGHLELRNLYLGQNQAFLCVIILVNASDVEKARKKYQVNHKALQAHTPIFDSQHQHPIPKPAIMIC